jgi:hypothetical protein
MYARPIIFTAFAGKFPGDDYIDARHSRPPAGDLLDANLGRFPLICTSAGVSIGQSSAINFYIASLSGLLGSNATETALVLSFSAHIQARYHAAQDIAKLFSVGQQSFLQTAIESSNYSPTQELQEAWARLVPFGNVPTEQNFKTFFEASDARDFCGPADSQTISQRYPLQFAFKATFLFT